MADDKVANNTKLTPELADKLVETVTETRLFDNQVAIMCGVSPATLRNWLRWGLHGNGKQPYTDFAKRYTEAQTGQEVKALKKIAKSDDWRAEAWYLEKKQPKRYGANIEKAPDTIDMAELIAEAEGQHEGLVALFTNPPPELQDAMKAAAPHIRAFLDRECPILTSG
jgi:transposase-like protein